MNLNEAMNAREIKIKRELIQYLNEDGFPTFAAYLKNFHINLLTSEQAGEPFTAATDPEKGIVLINPNIPLAAVSVLLRHEIAHNVFKHRQHMFYKLKEMGIKNPSQFAYRFSNVVGDYHISNKIYDKSDQKLVKGLFVEGDPFPGLVTELDFPENPEYWTMDFDELWNELVKEYDKKDFEEQAFEPSEDFIKAFNEVIDAYNNNELTDSDINDYFANKGGN